MGEDTIAQVGVDTVADMNEQALADITEQPLKAAAMNSPTPTAMSVLVVWCTITLSTTT